MEVINDLTPVNFTPKDSRRILGIVLHSMWGTQAGSISWFKNPTAGASAHYCISSEGQIVRCVLDKNIAWHAGRFDEPIADWLKPNPNYVTIGIELEDKRDRDWGYPAAQRAALRWLVTDLCKKYNIPQDVEHILLHKNLNPSRRTDPVGAFDIQWVLEEPMGDCQQLLDKYKIKTIDEFDHKLEEHVGLNWGSADEGGGHLGGARRRVAELEDYQKAYVAANNGLVQIEEKLHLTSSKDSTITDRVNAILSVLDEMRQTIEDCEKPDEPTDPEPNPPPSTGNPLPPEDGNPAPDYGLLIKLLEWLVNKLKGKYEPR